MNSVQHSLLLVVCHLILKCFVIWCFMHGWRCTGRMWEKLYFKKKNCVHKYTAWLQNSLGWLAVVVCNKIVIITSEFEYFIWNCLNVANCCHFKYGNVSHAHTIPDNLNTMWVPCHARYAISPCSLYVDPIYFGQYVPVDVLTWMCLMLCISLC
jgi:hypothetical protein